MATKIQNPQLEHAVLLAQEYVPDTVLDNWRVLGTAAIMVGLALCPVAAWARESYQTYLSVGPGGMPHNVLGWLLQGAAQLVARHDTRDHGPFSEPRLRAALGEHGSRGFLVAHRPPLPRRRGGRPVVPGFVAPQRQVSDRGPRGAEMRARLVAHQGRIARANPSLVFADMSRLEGAGHPGERAALWFAVGRDRVLPPYLRKTKGEFAHVHPEASMHVTLSLADAEEVVRKGWGERHPLSGVRGFWPITYVMIYAPRDDAELEICKSVLDASVRFVCCGGPEVRQV